MAVPTRHIEFLPAAQGTHDPYNQKNKSGNMALFLAVIPDRRALFWASAIGAAERTWPERAGPPDPTAPR
jgi:hypothetical protein